MKKFYQFIDQSNILEWNNFYDKECENVKKHDLVFYREGQDTIWEVGSFFRHNKEGSYETRFICINGAGSQCLPFIKKYYHTKNNPID